MLALSAAVLALADEPVSPPIGIVNTMERLAAQCAPEIPLSQGNRTIFDKLVQRYPELGGTDLTHDYRITLPESLHDLAIVTVQVKIDDVWVTYRLELVG